MRRMKVVELYSSLLNVGSDAIHSALLSKGIFQDLLVRLQTSYLPFSLAFYFLLTFFSILIQL